MLLRLSIAASCAVASSLLLSASSSAQTQPEHAPSAAPIEMNSRVLAAKRIDHTEPEYPENARRQHISGTVVLHVVVSAEGLPEDVRIMASVSPSIDRAALDAVKKFRYQPMTVEGVPVAVDSTITMIFALNGERVPPPVVPSIKVDAQWIKRQRDAIAALDPGYVSVIRNLLEATHLSGDVLKENASRFVKDSSNQITAYFGAHENSYDIADKIFTTVSTGIDAEFLSDLMILAYSKRLTHEQIEDALKDLNSPGGAALRATQATLDFDFQGFMRDYKLKVLVPEIDEQIRRKL